MWNNFKFYKMKKLNFLSWFLIILIVFSIIGMIGNIGARYFSEEVNTFDRFSFWVTLLNNMFIYIGLFFLQRALHLIYKLRSFTNRSVGFFNKSALFLLISSLIGVVLITFSSITEELKMIHLAFYFSQIILVLFLFALNDIVKLGKTYQEENELTI